MKEFLSGMYVAFSVVAALFFARFWCRNKDPLFLRFAAALSILAVERLALIFWGITHESNGYFYLLRLGAFAIIIWAVINKNTAKKNFH